MSFWAYLAHSSPILLCRTQKVSSSVTKKEKPSFHFTALPKTRGQRGLGLAEIADNGVVPNNKGRLLSDTSGDCTLLEEGLYVCGWLKRGPTGIIATNIYCAEETVLSVSEDLQKGVLASSSALPKPGREGLRQFLHDRNVGLVSFSEWEKINSKERRRGRSRNKPREKLSTREELQKAVLE